MPVPDAARRLEAAPPAGPDAAGCERLADGLLRAISSVRRTSRRHSGRPAELSALTGAQLELARLVRRRPGVSVTDASHELRLASNTVSTLVRQLTGRRVLVRSADPADRRVARLDLAPEIRRKVDAWRDRRVVALGAAIASLPDADRQRLADALPLLERLARQLEDPGGSR